jgi:hypothetical protein
MYYDHYSLQKMPVVEEVVVVHEYFFVENLNK